MGHFHLPTEHETMLKPWGRNWEPRCKIVASVLFIFGIIALNTWWLAAIALIFVLGAATLMGMSLSFLLKRMSLIIPFILLMSVPLVFGGGWPPTPDRYSFAALIAVKALAAMAAMIVLSTSQPVEKLLDGLAGLRMPPAIITVIFLAFRYGNLFVRELSTARKALASRLFSGSLSAGALQVYGELCGGMFVKSLLRSETVYRAMLSRCFSGSLPAVEKQKIRAGDLLLSMAPLSFALALILIEQVVL